MDSNSTSFSAPETRLSPWLRATLAVLLLAAGVFCFVPRELRGGGDPVPASSDNCLPPEKPAGDYEARQTFVTSKDNFSGVVLLAATFRQRRSELSGTGEALLLDEKGKLCDSHTFPLRDIGDNRYFRIPFAVRRDSANRKWTLVLKLRKCAFYLADRKGDSELRLNGRRSPFMLKLWTAHQDPDAMANAAPHVYDFRFFAGVLLLLAAVPLLWRKAEKAMPDEVRSATAIPFYLVLFAFCLLYREYVFGDKVYVFHDIGCDTIDSYVPALKNFLHRPSGAGFSVTQALWIDDGMFDSTRFDPFNYLLFLLPLRGLAAGLLYILFLKYEVLALVSYRYFRLIFADRRSALIGCLLWTFTQFNILWGQHYHFLTAVVFFTILLWLLELMLRGRKLAGFFFILFAAWFAVMFFYFFYMFCIFSVIYVAARAFLRKDPFGQVFRQGLAVGGCLLFGILIGLFRIVPWVRTFLCSDRASSEITLRDLLVVKLPYVGTVAGRLLCPGFFREGNIHLDYYTAPNAFLSLLVVFMVAGLLFVRPKARTWGVAAFAGVAVFLPLFSFLMTMSHLQSRWFFMLHLALASGIVLFLREVRTYSKREKVRLLLYGAMFFLVLLCAGLLELVRGFHLPPGNIPSKHIVYPAIFAVSYFALYGGILFFGSEKFFYPLLIAVFVSEIVFGYQRIVTRRATVMKGDKTYSILAGSRYRDFRKLFPGGGDFARTELSVDFSCPVMTANLPTLFSVPGTSAYSSVRPAALRNFAPEQIWEINPNVFELRESFLANRLLGVKRKAVNHDGIPVLASLRARSGEWKLFELPDRRFGYVLPAAAECPPPPAETACQDRFLLMYSHWWKTPGKGGSPTRLDQYDPGRGFHAFLHRSGSPAEVYRPLDRDRNLCPDLPAAAKLPLDLAAGRPLRIDLPKPVAENGIYIMLLEVAASPFERLEVADRFARRSLPLFSGRRRYVFFLPFRNISSFTVSAASARVYDMELFYDPDFSRTSDGLAAKIDVSPVRNARFEDGVWSAEVENRSGEGAMLCVPFSHLPGWTATVDGEPVTVENINNGLLGIRLPRVGRNRVIFRRSPPGRLPIRIVSLVALAALLGCGVFFAARGRLSRSPCR